MWADRGRKGWYMFLTNDWGEIIQVYANPVRAIEDIYTDKDQERTIQFINDQGEIVDVRFSRYSCGSITRDSKMYFGNYLIYPNCKILIIENGNKYQHIGQATIPLNKVDILSSDYVLSYTDRIYDGFKAYDITGIIKSPPNYLTKLKLGHGVYSEVVLVDDNFYRRFEYVRRIK